MSGGYRVLIAGALAALLLTTFGLGWMSGYVLNNPGEERYQPYRYAADKPLVIDSATPRGAHANPLEHRAPCDNPKGETESDLCAQWKAANAAEHSAFWTKWGFWIGVVGSALLLWQIMLTRIAVEDTSEATEAMRKANEITQEEQRAWIALTAEPKLLRRKGVDGLYFQVDFVANNIGKTAATHFDIYNEIFFAGQGETGQDVYKRILAQVEEWKGKHWAKAEWVLLPGDKEVSPWWDSREADVINWWTQMGIVAEKVAQPILVAIVLYKTPSRPNSVQCSWRAWYLHTVDERGRTISLIPIPNGELGPDRLCVEPFRTSLNHEEYPDKEA